MSAFRESMAQPSPHAHGRILVVDDSAADLGYIVRVLRDAGHIPHAANSASVALSFIHGHVADLPDLVLLDVHLPDVDGYEVCRQLKADPRTCDVPVIFVSAENRMLDRVHAFASGAVDYISKPFNDEEALARVNTHLSLRRLQARLVEEKERAERASLAKSQFLANMSHELRTPLNAILGYAQILAMAGGMDARQARGIAAIGESGQHLLRLINDILDLARVEAGKIDLLPVPTSVTGLLDFVSGVIGVRAEHKGLLYDCQAGGGLPPVVMVDEKRLSQVLLNLLGNAVKFTAQGRVSLNVRALSTDEGVARLRFAVEDSGAGIDAGDLETIFKPFEQVGGMQQRAGGTGLGLAISRRLVQLMGSEIGVESQVGVGSRFWFDLQLPLAEGGIAVPGLGYQSIGGYAGRRRTILIADDIAANRDVAAGMLDLVGFNTASACNGREALEQVRIREPDLLIIDVLMPVMDGLQAIRTLRDTPGWAQIPIIAMSASSYESDRQKALEAGADAFLPKPLDVDQLFETLARLLALRWTSRG
jgi:signal transduction histidine kinase